MSNCVNCGLMIVPPGVTYAGMSCRCFTETGSRLDAELNAIRSRLQALEQNTVPSGGAKQKLDDYLPPVTKPIRVPREWDMRVMGDWLHPYDCKCDLGDPCEHVRVREVLDD